MQLSTADKKIKGYRRLIPSMTALLEFEAVARLGSFTLAAQELGVTQAAVSKQVRFLEETLGARLFHRLHRAIRLTHEGQVLYAGVSDSVQRMASVFDRIAEGVAEREIVVACSDAFSRLRIMPRLAALRASHPDLQLRLICNGPASDIHRGDVDLAIRFGNGKWDDGTSVFLLEEEVFPVCSPSWLATHPAPACIEDFARTDLIDAEATLEGWMTWNGWCRALGDSRPRLNYALRCSSYGDAVDAAVGGHGIALGWSQMTRHLLASDKLVRLAPYSVKLKDGYYAVMPTGKKPPSSLHVILEWLREDVSPPYLKSVPVARAAFA